jgi:uncharacterized protein (TIGR03437 family)
MNWKTAFVLVACAAALVAQAPPVTILEIDTDNVVFYHYDVGDPSKFGSVPAVTPPLPAWPQLAFRTRAGVGDIVGVNGKAVKGVWVYRAVNTLASATYTPGRPIADRNGNCTVDEHFLILQPDGTEVGTIMTSGLGTPVAPPGSPGAATQNNMAVVGGTGVFLGARGQMSYVSGTGVRHASMMEDPANRRINGGGSRRVIIHLIPMTRPEVLTGATGPAIFHASDFSPVTSENPARAGEVLVTSAANLGPVRPNLDPGKPFPPLVEAKVHAVNSPVEVTVNGKAAQVINALGWPGMNNVYRVDFRVPEGTAAGTATLGLSVAWINGPEVKIPVR